MKYSEDVEERGIQMLKEEAKVREIAHDAPIGQLLNMIDVIAHELLLHSGGDHTREELLGMMIYRVVSEDEPEA